MKKVMWIAIVTSAFMLATMPVRAINSLIQLKVTVSDRTMGEKADYEFLLSPIAESFDTEQWISLMVPEGVIVPESIATRNIRINETTSPIECLINSDRTIRLLIPPINASYLTFTFTDAGQFTNPLQSIPVTFTLVWEVRSLMVTSNTLQFEIPDNTIESVFSDTQAVPNWYNQPVTLSLHSSIAVEILYTINHGQEMTYDSPILFDQGYFEVSVFGIRQSDAREKPLHIKVQVDTEAPEIKLVSPKENFITNESILTFQFQTFDLSTIVFMIQEKTYRINSNGSPVDISIPVSLQDGVNRIQWKVTDEVGFSTSGSLTVNLDTTPPALSVYSPRKGDIICGDHVEITGKAEPGSRLFFGEKLIPLDVFGNFSMYLVPTKGQNTLLLSCLDPAGNESRVTVEYVFYAGKVVEIWINQDKAKVQGSEVPISPPPLIEPDSGEIYLPLRFLPSVTDYQLEWNAKDSVAVLTRNKLQILIRPNDVRIRIKSDGHNENIDLTHPPLLMNKVVMIPAEFLKKVLGAELLFDEDEQRLFINFCDRSES